MRTKTTLSTSLASLALPALALGASAGFFACAAEFELTCPEGTTQTAGGGDVNEACKPSDQVAGAAGSASGSGPGGAGGSAGGGSQPPPTGECQAGQKQCSAESLSECGADGKWQAPAACEISCDTAKNECVTPVQLAAGSSHACALLSDGTVRCWGRNDFGQLGTGTAADSTTPVPVANVSDAEAIKISFSTTCARLKNGQAKCWGRNQSKAISSQPQDSIQSPLDLGATDLEQVAVGDSHLCVMTRSDHSVQCRGSNSSGQIGNGTIGGFTDPPVDVFSTAQGIAGTTQQLESGSSHNCALTTGGTVFCWGAGDRGQNGSPDNTSRPNAVLVEGLKDVTALAVGESVSCAVTTGGVAVCWGSNAFNLLGRSADFQEYSSQPAEVAGLSNVAKLVVPNSAGFGVHACAVKDDNTLWCWGSNRSGELGVQCSPGEGACDNSPLPVRADVGDVTDVAVGGNAVGGFSCAVKTDHDVYCWGNNSVGQLGIGRTSAIEREPQRVKWK